jgi:hypothetical protein
MSTNTAPPETWDSIAFRVETIAKEMRRHVRAWCVQWHVRHRRCLRVDMLQALRVLERTACPPAGETRGVVPDLTQRERSERIAKGIRWAEDFVVGMLLAESDAEPEVLAWLMRCEPAEASAIPPLLAEILWKLPTWRSAAAGVERAAAAHDAAMDELFNPEGST